MYKFVENALKKKTTVPHCFNLTLLRMHPLELSTAPLQSTRTVNSTTGCMHKGAKEALYPSNLFDCQMPAMLQSKTFSNKTVPQPLPLARGVDSHEPCSRWGSREWMPLAVAHRGSWKSVPPTGKDRLLVSSISTSLMEEVTQV